MERRASKAFHVSPFCSVAGDYRFRFFVDEQRQRTLVRVEHDERFLAQRGPIQQLGFDQRFMRTWEFYLAYCEAAFAQHNCGVVQLTLQKQ